MRFEDDGVRLRRAVPAGGIKVAIGQPDIVQQMRRERGQPQDGAIKLPLCLAVRQGHAEGRVAEPADQAAGRSLRQAGDVALGVGRSSGVTALNIDRDGGSEKLGHSSFSLKVPQGAVVSLR